MPSIDVVPVEESVFQFKAPSIRALTAFSRNEIIRNFKIAKFACSNAAFDLKISPGQEFGKILIVIPKKVGNAPKRNLVRRRIKSIFYEEKLFLNKINWFVLCKKPITALEFNQLKTLLLECNGKINK